MKTLPLFFSFVLLTLSPIKAHEGKPPTLTETLTPQSMTINKGQEEVVLFFIEKASFHSAPLNLRECFHQALKSGSSVVVTMDPMSLKISSCSLEGD